ncbi:MAG: YggS family pyridoxal phosphate-dependent enzyme [Bacilli bacterium]|nr:YggS family pyridoxal phosphate-dependent enzyme [Bacilli bacterium]
MSIKEQIQKIKNDLSNYPNVNVVAATKYVGIDKTQEIINEGIFHIGENRVDTFLEKYEAITDERVVWHFLGVLQTRKVRSIIDKIDYLHSLDSISLATEINKRRKTPLKCFVQVNISSETNKSGLDETKVIPFVKSLAKYENIEVVGLMCIAKLTFDDDLLNSYFERMKYLQEEVKSLKLPNAPCNDLSMGMSNDYKIALQNGATFIRLGRILLK